MVNKRGQVGLEKGKHFIFFIAFMGIIAFTLIVILQSINDTSVASTSGSSTAFNETLTTVTETGENLSIFTLPDVICAVNNVFNASGTAISSGNYTETNCLIQFTGTDLQYNNTDWDVTFDYTYNRITGINNNITGGVESFFSNAGTWFALLAVVILILIVVIVIKAVSATDKGGL